MREGDNIDQALKAALEEARRDLPKLVLALAGKMQLPAHFADDVMQEAELALMKGLPPTFDPGDDLRAAVRKYVMAIARNKIIDYKEREERARRLIKDSMMDQAERQGPAPVVRIADDQLHQRLETCISKLNTDDRDLLFMKYNSGLTFQHIADKLDLDDGTVSRRHSRILDDLLACLGSTGAVHYAMRNQQ